MLATGGVIASKAYEGEVCLMHTPLRFGPSQVAVSTDNSLIAVSFRAESDLDIQILDTDLNELLTISGISGMVMDLGFSTDGTTLFVLTDSGALFTYQVLQ